MDLTRPENLQRLMRRHGINYRKSLGQNFLSDRDVLNRIVEAGDIGPDTQVLEVGPGVGTITRELSQRAGHVVAIELDDGLIGVLKETLADCTNVEVIHQDILKIDLGAIQSEQFKNRPFAVIANLPYYITTPVLMSLIQRARHAQRMVFMVQREVAQRMAASPGSKAYGTLSLAVQSLMRVRVLFDVPADAFTPAPNVASAVVRLDRLSAPALDGSEQADFLQLVHFGFAMRRKTLANNLMAAYGLARPRAEEWLNSAGFSNMTRAEQLGLEDFVALLRMGKQHQFICPKRG